MAVNYQLELERELQKNEGKTPRLLLHCCCAPCSSYVLEYLSPHFSITAHYYNPNIGHPEEYAHRARDLSRLCGDASARRRWMFCVALHAPRIYAAVKGLEDVPEAGAAAMKMLPACACPRSTGRGGGRYDYFTTTLSLSRTKTAV
jgi:predicted adenine nucleotide alpha hydrolase (AANH) superfamily ATPase